MLPPSCSVTSNCFRITQKGRFVHLPPSVDISRSNWLGRMLRLTLHSWTCGDNDNGINCFRSDDTKGGHNKAECFVQFILCSLPIEHFWQLCERPSAVSSPAYGETACLSVLPAIQMAHFSGVLGNRSF